MIDELELAFDEPADRGRHRHRRGARKKEQRQQQKQKRGAGKTFFALFVVLLLLGGLAGGAWYGIGKVRNYFSAPDYAGGGTGQVQVEIKQNDTLTDMGNTLVKADVVKSAAAFVDAADKHPRGHNIMPGFYNMRKQMRAADAVALLLESKTRIVAGVTIPEGKTAKQTYKLLSGRTKIPVAEFEAAAKDPVALGVPEGWFKRSDGRKIKPSIEGFLFPQTYEFPPKATAEQVLSAMVKQFLAAVEETGFETKVAQERGGITPYEALIVASLAQAEAGNPDDLGKVARVAYNRLYSGTFPCSCLEMDVTVNYWLDLQGKATKESKHMTAAEMDDPKNPYNRKLRGLIPTPINNPGKLALEGSMAPPAGKWLYFVAIDTQGHSAFAETYADHEKNIAKAKENGVL